MNETDKLEQSLKDIEYQLSFITDDFDLAFFVQSLIDFRVDFFDENKKDLMEELTKTINND
jgi:hypothetical protein